MRVLFFNYEYPPLGGGAGNATAYLMKEFSKISSLEIDLITSSVDEHYQFEKIGHSINIHKLPIGKNQKNLHFQSQKDLLTYSFKAYWFAKELIKKNKYDLTHSFFSVPCGFISMLLKQQHGIPYIVSLRGADVPGYSERFFLLYKILTLVIKKVWENADFVVANSQGLKELALESKPDQEIDVIYNGIDIEEFYPTTKDEVTRKKFVVLCVSRLTRRKGINYLIDGFKELSGAHPEAELVIVGEGDVKDELERQATAHKLKSKVKFTGLMSHNLLTQVYQQANVFVLPSLNEGMSNTMLEALSSGLPIVATDTGGTKELVTDGENGFIIKQKDGHDIAEKLELLIQEPSLASKMSKAGRKKAEDLSWKSVAREYLNIYKKL